MLHRWKLILQRTWPVFVGSEVQYAMRRRCHGQVRRVIRTQSLHNGWTSESEIVTLSSAHQNIDSRAAPFLSVPQYSAEFPILFITCYLHLRDPRPLVNPVIHPRIMLCDARSDLILLCIHNRYVSHHALPEVHIHGSAPIRCSTKTMK